jgi:predicted lipid carrier protein YhbT
MFLGRLRFDEQHDEEVARLKDLTAEFFDRLGRGDQEMLPKKITTTIRFDLEHDGQTDHWFIEIEAGLIRVSREDRPADCVTRAGKCLFERITTGEANVFSEMFRNRLIVEGDRSMMLLAMRKLFPGPPGAHDSRVSGR